MGELPTSQELADTMAEMVRREILACSEFSSTSSPQNGETPATLTLKIVAVLNEETLEAEREWKRNHIAECAECQEREVNSDQSRSSQ